MTAPIFESGALAVFKVADASSAMTDISQYLKTTGISQASDTYEVTTLGKLSKIYIPGLKDGTIPGDGPYDPVAHVLLAGILSKLTTWEFYPQGVVTGKPKVTGAGILHKLDIADPAGAEGTISFELQCSDDVTVALVS